MHPYMLNRNAPFLSQSNAPPLPAIARRGLLRRIFGSIVHNWKRHRMIAALEAMDDHLLRDIGIHRSEILHVVDGLTARELSMPPVSPALQRDAARLRAGERA
ncbi:DUF1127 domain-containing protein [Pseudooceanicola sp.]|uniref:DUF1127 domain-containing protein n=1 Tax=Pseudooceanicola sp. TaxID=1914328 RepID=UPI004059C309